MPTPPGVNDYGGRCWRRHPVTGLQYLMSSANLTIQGGGAHSLTTAEVGVLHHVTVPTSCWLTFRSSGLMEGTCGNNENTPPGRPDGYWCYWLFRRADALADLLSVLPTWYAPAVRVVHEVLEALGVVVALLYEGGSWNVYVGVDGPGAPSSFAPGGTSFAGYDAQGSLLQRKVRAGDPAALDFAYIDASNNVSRKVCRAFGPDGSGTWNVGAQIATGGVWTQVTHYVSESQGMMVAFMMQQTGRDVDGRMRGDWYLSVGQSDGAGDFGSFTTPVLLFGSVPDLQGSLVQRRDGAWEFAYPPITGDGLARCRALAADGTGAWSAFSFGL